MKKLIFLILLLGAGAFAFFRPNDAKAIWTIINIRILAVLGGDQSEYTPPKAYFFSVPLQIVRWPEPGKILELTDFSKWELQEQVPGWNISQEMEVSYSNDPNWPYTLFNTDKNSRVNAKFKGKK